MVLSCNTPTRMKNPILVTLVISLASLFGGWFILSSQKMPLLPESTSPSPVNVSSEIQEEFPTGTVFYGCANKKSILAQYDEKALTSPEEIKKPFLPQGSVSLKLGDGRKMILRQTISTNGARYANPDQSLVFWGKGKNRALIIEHNTITFANCVRVVESPDDVSLPKPYSQSDGSFSLRLPSGYTDDEMYQYTELGPGNEIVGVKFTLPLSVSKGTNLSEDSYISVEKSSQAQKCAADIFFAQKVSPHALNEHGQNYSVASSTGAAAGNRYEETVYALVGTNPCVAVRYFVHYGVRENYPQGLVREFDKQTLLKQFDAIRHTLLVVQ